MPIDPNTMNQANSTRKAGAAKQSMGAAQSAIRNKGQQGLAMKNPNATKQPGLAKPNIGKPATPLGVNKKKPLLAPGSVRANAMRQADMQQQLALKNQAAQQMSAVPGAELNPYQNMEPGLNLAPTQLPYDPGMQEMSGGMPMAQEPQINNALPGQLNLQPTQLPFDQNKMNPMGSQPGQFGPVNPAIQAAMQQRRGQMGGNIDMMRNRMQQNRMRGGY